MAIHTDSFLLRSSSCVAELCHVHFGLYVHKIIIFQTYKSSFFFTNKILYLFSAYYVHRTLNISMFLFFILPVMTRLFYEPLEASSFSSPSVSKTKWGFPESCSCQLVKAVFNYGFQLLIHRVGENLHPLCRLLLLLRLVPRTICVATVILFDE